MRPYREDDYLPLSGIQHFCYCRRQWALIHLEQVWRDDGRTASGSRFHRNVDDPGIERAGDVIVLRSVPVSSPSLGLSGVCDVVELHEDGDGSPLPGRPGLYRIVPVEYKVGHRKAGQWDAVQVCAQAIALEESTGVSVDEGHIFYGAERRRQRVKIDRELRETVNGLAEEMHRAFESHATFEPEWSWKCRGCSLADPCMPGVTRSSDVRRYLEDVGRDV